MRRREREGSKERRLRELKWVCRSPMESVLGVLEWRRERDELVKWQRGERIDDEGKFSTQP